MIPPDPTARTTSPPSVSLPTNSPLVDTQGDSESVPASYESSHGQESQAHEKIDGVRFENLAEWGDESAESVEQKLARCQVVVDHQFTNTQLLLAALTHASSASHRLASNERLEFLGDSILGLVVCEWLYEEYPGYSEGDLTKIKSSVVSRRSCGKAACELGLDKCLIVGKGVTKSRSFPRSLVSDVFESVVAAIYLDAGLEVVRTRIKRWLALEVSAAVDDQSSGNYKSTLQQFAQRERASTPIYRLIGESGPDHRKRFQIAAVIDNEQFQPAWGNNKKDAEQHAAANALAILQREPPPFE